MKVLLRYIPQDDEDDELETSFSLTLPKAWLGGPLEKLRHLFVDQFNKKHTEALPMDKADCRLETKSNQILDDQTVIETCLNEGDELFLKRGKQPIAANDKATSSTVTKRKDFVSDASPAAAAPTSTVPAGAVACKRFGCGKRFVPGQPATEPCRHHKKPPVFHETRKYWACCPDKVAWDWDSFQAITGCEELPEHTNVAEGSKRVMGGTELRAEIQGPREIGTEKKVTGLDKLMALRASLINVGISGDVFDKAQDTIKRVHEDAEGKNIWDKVGTELGVVFGHALQSVVEKYN